MLLNNKEPTVYIADWFLENDFFYAAYGQHSALLYVYDVLPKTVNRVKTVKKKRPKTVKGNKNVQKGSKTVKTSQQQSTTVNMVKFVKTVNNSKKNCQNTV